MSRKSERLHELLGSIDDQYIEETAPETAEIRSQKTGTVQMHWKRWIVPAACFLLAAGLSISFLSHLGGNQSDSSGSSALPEDGAGSEIAPQFMAYACPVLPMTLSQTDPSVTAARELTLDFSPWIPVWVSNEEAAAQIPDLSEEERQEALKTYEDLYPEGGHEQTSTRIAVTDSYTLANASSEEKTVSVLYPFVSSLRDLSENLPVLYEKHNENQTELSCTLHAGRSKSISAQETGFLKSPESWQDYQTLLSEQDNASLHFDEYPDFTDTPVILYTFSDPVRDGSDAASIAAMFSLDPGTVKVLSNGFNGSDFDAETGTMKKSFFIPGPEAAHHNDPRYLIVIGGDLQNLEIQGYADGGCNTGDERDFTAHVSRSQTSLEEIAETIARRRFQDEDFVSADFDLYFGLFKESLQPLLAFSDDEEPLYSADRLDDLNFAEVQRVFYLEAQVTIPPQSSIEVQAEMTKEASYNYYGSGRQQDVFGYDAAVSLGSNLDFTSQTAILEDYGQIEVVHQNFGFDPEAGLKKVPMDPEVNHYWLVVRKTQAKN